MERYGTAILLAGGKSSRMGFDKQTIEVNGVRMIDRSIEILKQEFQEIIVVTKTPELYKNLDVVLTQDIIPDKGPLSGIHAALTLCKSEFAYVIACDMPYIHLDYIRFMKKQIDKNPCDACVTRIEDRIEPLNAYYAKGVKDQIEERLQSGTSSIFEFVKTIRCTYIAEADARDYSSDWRMFSNINTREELNALLAQSN